MSAQIVRFSDIDKQSHSLDLAVMMVMMMVGDIEASQRWASVILVSRGTSLLLLNWRDIVLCPLFLCNGYGADDIQIKPIEKDDRLFII